MFKVVQGKEMRYCVYAHPDAEKEKLPLIVFLHGAGERGKNFDHIYRHGIPKLIKEGLDIDAVVLFPQCPKKDFWAYQFKNIDMKFEKPVKAEAVMPPIFKAVKEMIAANGGKLDVIEDVEVLNGILEIYE